MKDESRTLKAKLERAASSDQLSNLQKETSASTSKASTEAQRAKLQADEASQRAQRAEEAAQQLAASRGHVPVRLEAKAGFANLLLWKTVYEANGRYYVDAIRVGTGQTTYPGTSAEKLNTDHHYPWLKPNSQQAKDIERFRWFSNDYLAIDPRVDGAPVVVVA